MTYQIPGKFFQFSRLFQVVAPLWLQSCNQLQPQPQKSVLTLGFCLVALLQPSATRGLVAIGVA